MSRNQPEWGDPPPRSAVFDPAWWLFLAAVVATLYLASHFGAMR